MGFYNIGQVYMVNGERAIYVGEVGGFYTFRLESTRLEVKVLPNEASYVAPERRSNTVK